MYVKVKQEESKTYFVKWAYEDNVEQGFVLRDSVPVPSGEVHLTKRRTSCLIYEVGEDKEKVLVATATVTCHFHDTYDKEKGRKWALDAALHLLWPRKPKIDKDEQRRLAFERVKKPWSEAAEARFAKDKAVRELFYEAFRTLPKSHPKWIPKDKQKRRKHGTFAGTEA